MTTDLRAAILEATRDVRFACNDMDHLVLVDREPTGYELDRVADLAFEMHEVVLRILGMRRNASVSRQPGGGRAIVTIVDDLRRASEALRKRADDLQALSDEVYIGGGEPNEEQGDGANNLYRYADVTIHRLDNPLIKWRIDRL